MTSFPSPDYAGGSLESHVQPAGALAAPPTDYPEAGLLSATELRAARRVVLLLIDTGPEHYVQLAEHPDLAACLRLPLCGEPRAGYCYVRPEHTNAFERYVAEVLQPYCECIASADLIERGFFGLGAAHPELAARSGDYVLLLKGQYVIKDYVAGEKPFFFAGVHSGLSTAELHIPLVVACV